MGGKERQKENVGEGEMPKKHLERDVEKKERRNR